MKKIAALMTILAAAAAASSPASASPAVIGYLPAFRGLEASAKGVDFGQYTHINLAFANPDAQGRMTVGDRLACAPDGAAGMVSRKKLRQLSRTVRRSGAKLLVSLGGGVIPGCSGDWAALLAPGKRDRLVKELVAMVEANGLDGIDVDLEGDLMTGIDRAGNYTPFVAALAAALHARGKLLTCATASYDGGMVPDSALPHFDLVGIMSYDAIGPTWGQRGTEHSSLAQAERDLALWIGKGVPREKLALGVPFYGYGFGQYRQSYALKDVAAEYGEQSLQADLVGQLCATCDYVTYNGLATLRSKGVLAGKTGTGVMVWEISQDLPGNRAIRSVRAGLRDGAEGKQP